MSAGGNLTEMKQGCVNVQPLLKKILIPSTRNLKASLFRFTDTTNGKTSFEEFLYLQAGSFIQTVCFWKLINPETIQTQIKTAHFVFSWGPAL